MNSTSKKTIKASNLIRFKEHKFFSQDLQSISLFPYNNIYLNLYLLIITFLALGAVYNPFYLAYAGALLAIRLIMLMVGLPTTMNVLEQASLLPFVLICDFLISLFLFSLGCLTAFKVHTWTKHHPHNVHKKTSNW